MQISKWSTAGVALVAAAVATAIACERPENPNAPLVRAGPSFKDRAPAFAANHSPGVTAIEAQIRATKSRGLTAEELARVKDKRATWKWVGIMHHKAMQEAIHDQSIKGVNSEAGRCAVRARYGMKYAATGPHPLPDQYKTALVRSVNERFDFCLTVPPGRIFSPRSASGLLAADGIQMDTLSETFVDYVYALGNQLGGASSLQDANSVVNSFIVTLNNDPSLSPVARDALSAAASLAASSAAEWDGFYLGDGSEDSHEWEMNLFAWGWLSSVGKWVSDVVRGDVYGCGYGMIGVVLVMSEAHISLSLPEFGQAMGAACAAGGITGSILAAF